MTRAEVLAAIDETDADGALAPGWDTSAAAYSPDRLRFLMPEVWRASRAWCGLDAGLDPGLNAVASRVRSAPALTRLAWHYYWRTYEDENRNFQPGPRLERALGHDAGLFYVLVALDWVPRLRAWHRSLGIPEAITRNTARQIGGYLDNYRRAHGGKPGLFTSQLGWLRNYLLHRYVRVGRFEFWARRFDGEVEVFRETRTGATVALAAAGIPVDAKGYRTGGDAAAPAGWTTAFERTAAAVTGNPVSPRGRILRRGVTLRLDGWRRLLGRDDPYLDMHIPSGGGMSLEVALASFREGIEFFQRHFPADAPAAIVCKSWVFGPQAEEVLPPDSNLVRLAREVYLYPNPWIDRALWFVFLQPTFDPATAPRDTSLQRALHAFLSKGGLWRSGNMFVLAADVERLGNQLYRANCPFDA